MKAILLAAGLGSRLAPLTNTLPKCLVPINGTPLLGIWIDKLIALGVSEILINTHYLAEQVEQYIATHPQQASIRLVYEPVLRGTAGTLVSNSDFWKNDTCFIIHADNYCQSDLYAMVCQHQRRARGALATLLVFETAQPESCGIVKTDQNGLVTEFYEKQPAIHGNLASGALFIFSPAVFQRYFAQLEPDKFYELSVDVVPNMLGALQIWQTNAAYLDIGTPENYQKAQRLALATSAEQ